MGSEFYPSPYHFTKAHPLTPLSILSVEQFVGIIIASLPTLRPLFSSILEKATFSPSSSATFHKISSAYKRWRTNSTSSGTRQINNEKQTILEETSIDLSMDSELEKGYTPNYLRAWKVPDRESAVFSIPELQVAVKW